MRGSPSAGPRGAGEAEGERQPCKGQGQCASPILYPMGASPFRYMRSAQMPSRVPQNGLAWACPLPPLFTLRCAARSTPCFLAQGPPHPRSPHAVPPGPHPASWPAAASPTAPWAPPSACAACVRSTPPRPHHPRPRHHQRPACGGAGPCGQEGRVSRRAEGRAGGQEEGTVSRRNKSQEKDVMQSHVGSEPAPRCCPPTHHASAPPLFHMEWNSTLSEAVLSPGIPSMRNLMTRGPSAEAWDIGCGREEA